MKPLYRFLFTVISVLIIDGISKIWVEQALELHQPVSVIGDFFRFTLGYNSGVAFGLFADGGPWPLIVTGVIITGLIIWFIRSLYLEHLPGFAAWPVGFLLGGAIGNFIDRLWDSQVTDFLDVGIGATRWPTFNLADSFILIGISCLMILSFMSNPEPERAVFDRSTPESDSAV